MGSLRGGANSYANPKDSLGRASLWGKSLLETFAKPVFLNANLLFKLSSEKRKQMSSLQMSFADQEVSINRKQTRSEIKLSKIDRLVDWQKAVDQLSEMPFQRNPSDWQKFCTNQASRAVAHQKIFWLKSRCCSYSIYIIYQTLNSKIKSTTVYLFSVFVV